jgi:hypothetical protein
MRGSIIQFQACQGISLDFHSLANINLHSQIQLERKGVSKSKMAEKGNGCNLGF